MSPTFLFKSLTQVAKKLTLGQT